MTFLQHLTTCLLRYPGDCLLLGITPDQRLYVEEAYGAAEDDIFLAQHILAADGSLMASADEAYGKQEFHCLPLPDDLIKPAPIIYSHTLRYVGGRLCGLREEERAAEWVQPLTLPEKMALFEYFKGHHATVLPVASPMMIIGVAESIPLAEVVLEAHDGINQIWVCRRVRIAVALPARQMDADGEAFDYATIPLYLLHLYDPVYNSAPPLHESWAGLGKNDIQRPMSLLAHANRLYVGDGGGSQQVSRVQVLQITANS